MKMIGNKLCLFAILLSTLVLIPSCELITRTEVSTEKTISDIYNVTKESTTLALVKFYEDDPAQRAKVGTELAEKLTSIALPSLDLGASVDEVVADELLLMVPAEYHGLMAAAWETFNGHYEFPVTEEFLPEPQLSYLRSFLLGVRDGALQVTLED